MAFSTWSEYWATRGDKQFALQAPLNGFQATGPGIFVKQATMLYDAQWCDFGPGRKKANKTIANRWRLPPRSSAQYLHLAGSALRYSAFWMDWRTSARSEIISWLPRCRTITMISKCIALLVAALMLASCCALGNGCAPESRAPIARDGLGSSPASDSQPVDLQPEKRAPTKREIVVSPLDAEATEQDRTVQPQD
jgi:hypothetical protein